MFSTAACCTKANTTLSGGAPFVGALDGFTSDLAVVWSVSKRLLASYAGSLIRVRRSSDDAEMDIGFAANGSRDDAALAAFSGSGSAYVTTVYDQSGAGIYLSQATASIQPRIVNAGSIESGGMRFYSTQHMNTVSLPYTSFAGATAVQIVAKATIQTSPPNGRLFEFASTGEIAAWLPYGTDVYWDVPSASSRINATLPGGIIGNEKIFSFERSGANQQVVINNSVLTSTTSASGSLTATSAFCVASDALFNSLWLGWLDTMVLWKTTTNANARRLALA